MSTHHLVLVPRDGLSLKDARSYSIAGGLPATGLSWPTPRTTAGAVRGAIGIASGFSTRYGADQDRWQGLTTAVQVKGPLAVLRIVGTPTWKRLWPCPLDLQRLPPDPKRKDSTATWQWLRPEARPLGVRVCGIWSAAEAERQATEALWLAPARTRAKPLMSRLWLDDNEFVHWLAKPAERSERNPLPGSPVRYDVRLALDPATGAARDQFLFGQPTQEFLLGRGRNVQELGIALQVDAGAALAKGAWPPSDWLNHPWRLGGETRFAHAEAIADPFGFADGLEDGWKPSRFLRLCLVTPARFSTGWRPDWLVPIHSEEGMRFEGVLPGTDQRVILRAAFVDRPQWMSGWDLVQQQPKPSTPCVRAGAVYYFEAINRDFQKADLQALWLTSIHYSDDQERRDGFGLVVPGTWPTPADSKGNP